MSHFNFSQVITADYLSSLSLLNSKHLSIEPGHFQCTLFIYLSFMQTGKYLFHLLKVLEISNVFLQRKERKSPHRDAFETGTLWLLLPVQWHQSFLLLKKSARGIHDFIEVSWSLAQGFWPYLFSTSTASHGVLQWAECTGEFVVGFLCPHSTLLGPSASQGLGCCATCTFNYQLSVMKRN